MTPEAGNLVRDYNTEKSNEFHIENEKVEAAYQLALKAHKGQKRNSGEEYITHPLAVEKIIREEWRINNEELSCAAILHDTVEDTEITLEQLRTEFGDLVASQVDGVTNLRKEDSVIDKPERTNFDLRKSRHTIERSYIEPGVALIRLADRLHNMRTLSYLPEDLQKRKAQETLIYVNLAESLGIWPVKIELGDLAFKYLNPELFNSVKSEVDNDPRASSMFNSYMKSNLNLILCDEGVRGRVETRKNGYWEIYKKREAAALKGKSRADSFSEIDDLVSFRMIINDADKLFFTLGKVNDYFGENVDYERLNLYVGVNKRLNGYEAIQTSVNLPQGATEMAIVTEEMEEFNNWGLISLINKGRKDLDEYVLKLIFTQSGELILLPKRATGIDFAYAINKQLGADAQNLLIDGTPVSISTVIPNASVVEVVPSDKPKRAPNPGYLDYASPVTKKIINEQLILQGRDMVVERGVGIMETLLQSRGLLVLSDLPSDKVMRIKYQYNCPSLEDLYFKVGEGSVPVEDITRLLDKEGITKEALGLTTIRVQGRDKPGILSDLSNTIYQRGGNIENIDYKKDGDDYSLRLVIKGFDSGKENDMANILEKDQRFENYLVV